MAPRKARAVSPKTGAELSLVDALAELSFLVQGQLLRRAGEHELSLIQTRLLGVLRDRRPTMNELARLLELDKSSVSGLVDRAERRGLVRRMPSTTDRRAVLVALTASGATVAAAVGAQFASDVSVLLGSWSDSDRAALSGLAARVVSEHARERGVNLIATD